MVVTILPRHCLTQCPGKPLSVVPLPVADKLTVPLVEHPERRVAQHARHPGRVFVLIQHERGEGVPGLIGVAVAQACPNQRRVPDAIAHIVAMQWTTVSIREYILAFPLRRLDMTLERLLDMGQHLNIPAAAGRLQQCHLAFHDPLADVQDLAVKIHLLPLERVV